MPRTDRRIRRTRRQLRDALMALILEKGYDTITVQDITDRADLSRATFYLHYRDRDELLVDILEAMFDELVATLDTQRGQGQHSMEELRPSLLAFRHAQEYSSLYRVLLGERGVAYVIYRQKNYLARQARRQIETLLPESPHPPLPVDALAHYLAGALLSLIMWWLENDMPHTPEEMAEMYHTITLPAVQAALGLPHPGSPQPGD